ncbi:thiol-disulfide oxidoreductase DCC family protein [Endozoicomonadaceae bacterium StTr2]
MTLKRKDVTFPVTLFYDGHCPLCMKEIHWLESLNTDRKLLLVDIHQENFQQCYQNLDPEQLDRKLHARLGHGRLVTGIDATLAAWESVGRGFWIAPLRWPLMRYVADVIYKIFARNRHAVASRLGFLLGNPTCPPSRNKRP